MGVGIYAAVDAFNNDTAQRVDRISNSSQQALDEVAESAAVEQDEQEKAENVIQSAVNITEDAAQNAIIEANETFSNISANLSGATDMLVSGVNNTALQFHILHDYLFNASSQVLNLASELVATMDLFRDQTIPGWVNATEFSTYHSSDYVASLLDNFTTELHSRVARNDELRTNEWRAYDQAPEPTLHF